MKKLLEALIRKGDRRVFKDGTIEYTHFHSSERYEVDNRLGGTTWQQFDTEQDGWYFGIWVDPKGFQTISYAEGDWCYRIYPDAKIYNEQMDDYCKQYKVAAYAISLDDEGNRTDFYQDRKTIYACTETP